MGLLLKASCGPFLLGEEHLLVSKTERLEMIWEDVFFGEELMFWW